MKRILVVDGDTGVRARIAKHARMEGYDVTEAGDGETALSLSRQQNAFDLMVLAVNLPGMDGFTVLKAVRTFSAIPVLILSSKNTAEDRIHGLELGAEDYMTKPFSARELLLRISAILKRAGAGPDCSAGGGGRPPDQPDAQGVRPAHRADEPPGRGLLPQAPAGHHLGRGALH